MAIYYDSLWPQYAIERRRSSFSRSSALDSCFRAFPPAWQKRGNETEITAEINGSGNVERPPEMNLYRMRKKGGEKYARME